MYSKVIILIACLGLFGPNTHGQAPEAPILEKIVSIEFNQEPAEKVLERISNLGDFSFSYSPSLIENRPPISKRIRNKSIRETLDLVFEGSLTYKEKRRYVILLPNPALEDDSSPGYIILSGYINDVRTGKRLAATTLFERNTLDVTNSDQYGHFTLRINDPAPPLELSVFRNGYRDTTVVVQTLEMARQSVLVQLFPVATAEISQTYDRQIIPVDQPIQDTIYDPKPQLIPPISLKKLVMWNVTDTLERRLQISFVPFIGTNGLLSGNVTNEYSLNVIGGYSMENTKLELGGVFNANRANISGAQLAGALNLVGGGVNGLQMAGVGNVVNQNAKGASFAGAFNLHGSNHVGLRAAGAFNYTHKSTKGLSLAGAFNHQNGHCEGGQIAGALNVAIAGASHGQIAGALNVATGDIGGGQLAGALNVCSGNLVGAQVAGALNVANKVKGVQLGFVNVADSVDGVSIGFLTYVHHGYHNVELSSDESFRINLSLQTGVQAFYNIFSAGINPEATPVWYYGYGIGSSPRLGKRLNLDIQLTSRWINEDDIPKFNLLNRVQLGIDYRFVKNFSFFAGAAINGYMTDKNRPLSHFRLPAQDFIFYEGSFSNDIDLTIFPGVRAGLRIWW